MHVSENSGTPKSFILIGFSIINHPFWDIPIFGNTYIYICVCTHQLMHIYPQDRLVLGGKYTGILFTEPVGYGKCGTCL